MIHMETVRLTASQALVRFLENQYISYIDMDGNEQEHKFVKGIFMLPGHGNEKKSLIPPVVSLFPLCRQTKYFPEKPLSNEDLHDVPYLLLFLMVIYWHSLLTI